jgi:hypothetical protein
MANELEKAANAARQQLITNNTYNNFGLSNQYSSTHTRARSDEQTPIYGKGTGIPFDTYNGGGAYDIFGAPSIAGSGRIANVATNTYSEENSYTTPNTEGNTGQVIID